MTDNMTDNTTKIIKLNKSNKKITPSKPIEISNKNSNKKSTKNSSNKIKKSTDPHNINNVSEDKKLNLRITETEYERPIITHTEKLSKQQIHKLLEDYEQVKNIDELSKIPLGTHLRYFDTKDNNMKFRTGGVLIVNTGLPDYVILSSGHVSWSVQTNTSIFFRRVTLKEYKEDVQKTLLEKEATIKGLHSTVNEFGQIINDLKHKIKLYESLLKKNNIKIKT
jgi:hypothetical protein